MAEARRVCFPFVGDRVGGSHVSTSLLVKGLAARGRYEPIVVLHQDGALAAYLTSIGVPFMVTSLAAQVTGGSMRRAGSVAANAPRLRRCLRRTRCSIVHTNDVRMQLTWGLPSALAGCSFVWHQRSRYAESRLTRLAMMFADRVVCISQYGQSTMPRSLVPKMERIYNPFDLRRPDRTAARSMLRRECDLSDDHAVVGYVGNFAHQKRPTVFLEAAAKVRAAMGPRIAFVMLGADRDALGPELAALAARLGIADNLHLLGFRAPIEPWIAAMDALIAPGVEDAFGRTLVEAMIAGTPVVASDSGGHSEIAAGGRYALLAPADDAAAMADCVLRILDPESGLAAGLTDAAWRGVTERFTPEAHLDAMERLYDAL